MNENILLATTAHLVNIADTAEKLLEDRRHPNDGISLTHKLTVELEYLACGTLQRHIGSGPIIDDVCNALRQALQDEISPITPIEIEIKSPLILFQKRVP